MFVGGGGFPNKKYIPNKNTGECANSLRVNSRDIYKDVCHCVRQDQDRNEREGKRIDLTGDFLDIVSSKKHIGITMKYCRVFASFQTIYEVKSCSSIYRKVSSNLAISIIKS